MIGRRSVIQWFFTLFGLALIGVSILAAGVDAQMTAAAGTPEFKPIGEWWYELHRGSYGGVQVGLERYVWPPLWSHGVLPLIQWPVWAVFGPVGIISFVFSRAS